MIYLSDDIRIRKLDEQCLELEVYRAAKSKKTGIVSVQWKGAGYYGDLKSAIRGALKKQLFDLPEEELRAEDLFARIELAETNIIEAIEKLKTRE